MLKFYTGTDGKSRVGNIEIFLQIAMENYFTAKKYRFEYFEISSYLDLLASRKVANDIPIEESKMIDSDLDRKFELLDLYYMHSIQGLIAICIFYEAVINEIGITNFSRGFFDKHLEKMSITSKWTLIVRMVYQAAFDETIPTFKFIKELFIMRNTIVHYKSKVLNGPQQFPPIGEHLENGIFNIEGLLKFLYSVDSDRSKTPFYDLERAMHLLKLDPLPKFTIEQKARSA